MILNAGSMAGQGRLPSERSLCKLYSVSRTTAKKALNHLKRQRLVSRQVGKGTFISSPKRRGAASLLITPMMPGSEMVDFFRREAALFRRKSKGNEIRVVEVSRSFLKEMNSIPGTKIVYWSNLGYLGGLGVLRPLERYEGFKETLSQTMEEYCEWTREGLSREDSCLSIPLHLGVDMLAFNKSRAARLGLDADVGPSDWDGMLRWAEAASSSGFAPTAYSDDPKLALPYSYYLTATGGKDFLSVRDGNLEFDFSGGLEWINFFRRLYSMKGCIPAREGTFDLTISGRTLLTCNAGTWLRSQKMSHLSSDDISWAPIPPVKNGGPSVARISRMSLGIAGGPEENGDGLPSPAWDFIRHLLCDPGVQTRLVESFSSVPVNKAAFNSLKGSKEWEPVFKSLSGGMVRNSHPANFSINGVIRKFFREAVFGRMTAQEAAERIADVCPLQAEAENERSLF